MGPLKKFNKEVRYKHSPYSGQIWISYGKLITWTCHAVNMEPVFSERIRTVPKVAEVATMAILIPTDAFVLISAVLGWVNWWLFWLMAAVVLLLFAVFRLFVLKTDVYEDKVVIKYVRTRSYRIEKILDRRYGVMNDLRNYASVGLRGFKYRNYLCAGCETGVLFRTPNTIVAVSSHREEEFANLLPKAEKKKEAE